MKNETTMRSHLSLSRETAEGSHLPLAAIEELHRHWALFLALGIGLVVLGMVAMLTAGLSTIVAVDFFGWILVIAGAGVSNPAPHPNPVPGPPHSSSHLPRRKLTTLVDR